MYYIYRSTTDKLADHLNRITGMGDTVGSVHFTGGRDWVLVCRQGGDL